VSGAGAAGAAKAGAASASAAGRRAQVGEVGADWFAVYLIPETLRVTSLGAKREGATVNLEIEAQTQAIVDTVVARHLAALGGTLQPAAA
jgi:riboflavin synthase alpha subunit